MGKLEIVKDINGETAKVGTAVCVLTAGNFIYGHITEIISESRIKMVPDIGWVTSKPNFRVKKEYEADTESFGIVRKDDTVVFDDCTEFSV